MEDGDKCHNCRRIKKVCIYCVSCRKYSCETCLSKTYLEETTPFNHYFNCFNCKRLFSNDIISKKCRSAFAKKISNIYFKLRSSKPILHTAPLYAYMNQLYLADVPFDETEITKLTEQLHESFINCENFELPRIFPKLPVIRRLLKPGAPPELIELESRRCPVLTGAIEELYEAYSSDSTDEIIKNDYINRVLNEQIDINITRFENTEITVGQLRAMLLQPEFYKIYDDLGNRIDEYDRPLVIKKSMRHIAMTPVQEDEENDAN